MASNNILFYDSDQDEQSQLENINSENFLQNNSDANSFGIPRQRNNLKHVGSENKIGEFYPKTSKIRVKSNCCEPWVWLPILIAIIGIVATIALILSCHLYFSLNRLIELHEH